MVLVLVVVVTPVIISTVVASNDVERQLQTAIAVVASTTARRSLFCWCVAAGLWGVGAGEAR